MKIFKPSFRNTSLFLESHQFLVICFHSVLPKVILILLNYLNCIMSVIYQDWTPAGWDKRGKKSTEPREKQVNIARRLGNTVVTTEKCNLFVQLHY